MKKMEIYLKSIDCEYILIGVFTYNKNIIDNIYLLDEYKDRLIDKDKGYKIFIINMLEEAEN